MTTNDVFLDACKGLVMHCNCNILILNVLGDFRAYIAPEVRLKTRNVVTTKFRTRKTLQN